MAATRAKSKWSCTNDMVKALIDCVKDYKSTCEFNAIDFNSDKVRLYEEVRKAMALVFEESDFGPNVVCAPSKPVKEMTEDEYTIYKNILDKDKSMIKVGYNRIKEKLKSIRQDYSKAVVSGTRSGSGKIVLQYFDDLASIWGGSPATEPLSFGIDSANFCTAISEILPGQQDEDDFEESSSSRSLCSSPSASRASTPCFVSDDCNQPEGGEIERSECNEGGCSELESLKEKEKRGKRKSIPVSDVPKLIDNKRKHLEKCLTSAQRNQKLLEAAKEDTFMRKEMMECFKESSRSTAQAIENMSETMKGLTQGITQGIALLADALTRPPQLTYPTPNISHHIAATTQLPATFHMTLHLTCHQTNLCSCCMSVLCW